MIRLSFLRYKDNRLYHATQRNMTLLAPGIVAIKLQKNKGSYCTLKKLNNFSMICLSSNDFHCFKYQIGRNVDRPWEP